MDTSLAAGIKEYRAAAARRFLSAPTSPKTSSNENQLNDSQLPNQHATYQRAEVPGLEEYLRNSAEAYAQRKTGMKQKQYISQVLGRSKPIEQLHIAVRRERWLRLQSERKHFDRVTYQPPFTDFVAPCGIPRDVLQRAASRFLYRKKHCQRVSPKPLSEYVLGKQLPNESVEVLGIREDHQGYSVHIKRCEDLFVAGGKEIIAGKGKTRVRYDNFEDVRRRYAGRPDELYRRKTARKYATWRRKWQEEERTVREHELKAEKEMKRRRGHDQLLSSRRAGDASFVPFLYELGNNTYAYSSKITKAPKLHKMMIDKYTDCTIENSPEPSQCQKAQQTAQMNSLFHNRVMNRFS